MGNATSAPMLSGYSVRYISAPVASRLACGSLYGSGGGYGRAGLGDG